MFRYLLFVTCLSISVFTSAQLNTGCAGEPNPYFICPDQSFHPVCACDGKTYPNTCSAIFHGGIQNQSWTDGVCQPFWFYIPTIRANSTLPFSIQFQTAGGNAVLLITDLYGKIYLQRFYNVFNNAPRQEEFDVSGFKQGLYIITVYTSGHKQTERFVVIQP